MIRHAAFLICLSAFGMTHAVEITGAGSSAAAPLYAKWQAAYAKKTGIKASYQPIGSSNGIRAITEGAVDFGATDAPISEADAKEKKLLAFPTAISGVVPFINVPGIKAGELQLTGDILTGIYSGKITKWNDEAILQLNPKLALPNQAIVPFARADGSGTTFTLTDYFSRVNADWKLKFGTNFTIEWPSTVVTVKGSSNLVANVKKTPGAIGYVEHAYVVDNALNYIQLKNRDGRFVKPNANSFRSAVAKSDWDKTGNFEEMLTDKPGPGSWPITGATYVLIPKAPAKPAQTTEVAKFFTWAFMAGDEIASSLESIRLPDRVQARVFREISSATGATWNQFVMPTAVK